MGKFWAVFKKISKTVQHIVVACVACSLAFFLSIQFLTPALSSDRASQKKGGVGESAKGLVGEVKNVLKSSFSKDTPSPAPSGKNPPEHSVKSPSPPGDQNAPSSKQEGGLAETSASKDSQEGAAEQVEDFSQSFVEVESYMVPFIYDPGNKRNPFEDPLKVQTTVKGVEIVEVKTPPEKHDLREIDLKGIIWLTEREPKALVQLPDGQFYTLLRGDRIGRQGVIFEIREDEMVVLETLTKNTGSQSVTDTSITIKRMDRLGRNIRRLKL